MRRLGHLGGDPEGPGGVGAVVSALLALGARRGRDDVVLPVQRGLRELLERRDGLDGVVVHGVFDPHVARATALVRRTRPDLPLVALPHDAYDDGLFGHSRWRKHLYWRAVERRRLRSARAVVVLAPSHERWLRQRGVDVPVVVARCGLTTEELGRAGELRSRPRPVREVPLLVFAGRWDVVEKGLDLLLPAVAALPRGSVRLRLVGPEVGGRGHVAALAAGCGDDVELVGWAPDVWAEIADADLLVLPSRKEGFGLVGLQALACGVPVLLSSAAGLAEHVAADGGLHLVRPEAAAVASGLRTALGRLAELRRGAERFAADRAPAMTYDALDDALLRGLTSEPAR